jgi:hypothetical protein
MKILLITSIPPKNATTIQDHVDAFVDLSSFNVTQIDLNHPEISTAISNTDCLILHYSVVAFPYRSGVSLSSALRLQIRLSNKPVLHMVQDEQRNVFERFRYFQTLGVNHVFSVANEQVYNLMYPPTFRNFSVSTLLTGYSPINLDDFQDLEWNKRSIDISYRARRLPEWYGNLGLIKGGISDKLNSLKTNSHFIIDASCKEEDRIYGRKWSDFLCNSKVAVGTESGSSTLDFDGRYYDLKQTDSKNVFCDVFEPVVANYAAISPRIFEYAAAKCLLALTPGDYSGIIEPDIHYFELKPDLSNFEQLLVLMNDENRRNRLIENSYEHLIKSQKFNYSNMVREVDFWIRRIMDKSSKIQTSGNTKLVQNSSNVALVANQQLLFSRLSLNLFKRIIKHHKVKMLNWAYSRRGKTRLIIRAVVRMLWKIYQNSGFSSFQRNHIWRSIQHPLFKKTSNITYNIFKRLQLVRDLEFIKTETELLAPFGCQLSVIETESSLWISWPNALNHDDRLKSYPKLDSMQFPLAQGVWFTRSDYSQMCEPINLKHLSQHFKKSKQQIIKLIQLATAPRCE